MSYDPKDVDRLIEAAEQLQETLQRSWQRTNRYGGIDDIDSIASIHDLGDELDELDAALTALQQDDGIQIIDFDPTQPDATVRQIHETIRDALGE